MYMFLKNVSMPVFVIDVHSVSYTPSYAKVFHLFLAVVTGDFPPAAGCVMYLSPFDCVMDMGMEKRTTRASVTDSELQRRLISQPLSAHMYTHVCICQTCGWQTSEFLFYLCAQ